MVIMKSGHQLLWSYVNVSIYEHEHVLGRGTRIEEVLLQEKAPCLCTSLRTTADPNPELRSIYFRSARFFSKQELPKFAPA